MNKMVYAMPGPINSISSEGCNWLIKTGAAKIVTEIGDILGGVVKQDKFFELDLTNEENTIYQLLKAEPMTVDEISKKVNRSVMEVSSLVTTMAMKNLVNEEMGKVYLALT